MSTELSSSRLLQSFRCADGGQRRALWLTLVPVIASIALAVFWMGIYPESFMRPMRNDVGRLLVRLERVAPPGDSHIVVPTMANGMHADRGTMH